MRNKIIPRIAIAAAIVLLTLPELLGGGICIARPLELFSKRCEPSPDGNGSICIFLGDPTAPKCNGILPF